MTKVPKKGVVRVQGRRGVVFLARPSTLSVIFSGAALVSLVLALIAGGVPIVPMVWYRIRPGTVQALGKILARPAVSFGTTLEKTGEKTVWQPPLDSSLPSGGRIIIGKIGVNSPIYEAAAEQYEQALEMGVWRTPNLGTPNERSLPTVLVAHRFGYLSWNNTYRRERSFFNLPQLKPGDKVEIDWGQRQYIYEIYGGEEAEAASDLTADLILYTCKYLESDVRIFRYARLRMN